MGKFKITITNLENGKVLADSETNVIVSAFLSENAEGTHQMLFANAKAKDVAFTIVAAEKIGHQCCIDDTDIGLAYLLIKAADETDDDEDEEEDE